jgi:hypothetical protein
LKTEGGKLELLILSLHDSWCSHGGQYEGYISWDVTPCSLAEIHKASEELAAFIFREENILIYADFEVLSLA